MTADRGVGCGEWRVREAGGSVRPQPRRGRPQPRPSNRSAPPLLALDLPTAEAAMALVATVAMDTVAAMRAVEAQAMAAVPSVAMSTAAAESDQPVDALVQTH